MGSGGGRGEDGGGSGASGAARRTPPTPRLSTFLRTFGTTLAARAGVDVDAEYVSRRAILDARLSTAGSSSSSFSSSSSGARGTATAPLARSVCGPGVAPDRDARDALEAFLQAVVRVSGGDTLLPDQLADASLAALRRRRQPLRLLRRRGRAMCRGGCLRPRPRPRPPPRRSRVARVDAKEKKSPRRRRRTHRGPTLSSLRTRRARPRRHARGTRRPRRERGRTRRVRRRLGLRPARDRRLHEPLGTGAFTTLRDRRLHNHRRLDHTPRGFDAGGVDARGFARRPTPRIVVDASDAAAFADGVSPLDVADAAAGFDVPAAEASATEQLAWLKARCVEVSGFASWEETAGGVARALLSGGDATSDDVVASELFDLLGDAGVELVMGVVERRAAMTAAFRRRLTTLRDRLGGGDDGEVSKKFGGGSGAPGATVTITSTTDKKLAALRRKEERKAGRRLARGEGEPLLEWLASAGVGSPRFARATGRRRRRPRRDGGRHLRRAPRVGRRRRRRAKGTTGDHANDARGIRGGARARRDARAARARTRGSSPSTSSTVGEARVRRRVPQPRPEQNLRGGVSEQRKSAGVRPHGRGEDEHRDDDRAAGVSRDVDEATGDWRARTRRISRSSTSRP